MIREFKSYVLNNHPADNPCDARGKEKHNHTISIFSAGLTGQHFLLFFCDDCMKKDSIVFTAIAKELKQKAQELAKKGF